jgi:hypothetical protein
MATRALLTGLVAVAASALEQVTCGDRRSVAPGESVQAALDAAGAAAHACGRAVVSLLPGVHRLPAPLRVTAAHSHVTLHGPSGPASSPAVLDGGVLLPPFSPQPDGSWLTALPAANFTPETTPTTISVEGARRQRARSPNAVAGGGLAGEFGDAATYHAAGPLAACTAPAWGSCPAVDKLGFVYNARQQIRL